MLHLSSREEIGFGSFSNILNTNIEEIIVLDCSYDTNIKNLQKQRFHMLGCFSKEIVFY